MSELTKPKPRRRRQTKPTSSDNSAALSEQALRDAAYYLWEHEGRPDGRALDHWLQASRRLQPGKAAA